jgi:hypothetical protein
MQKGAPSLAWWSTPLDHVLGYARLRDLKPQLQQFAMDAGSAPKRVLDAHRPNQHPQLCLDWWPPSQRPRLPPPVVAKARPMPTHQRLGTDDRESLQDRRKPAIHPDKEPAVAVRQPDATAQLTPQNNQLMSKHRILGFKSGLRLERQDQNGQYEM